MKTKLSKALVAAAALSLLAACGPTGGYQRGLFTGYVVGATEDEITSKIGKPEEVDTTDAKAPRWVYKKKTFDPDNMNQVDARTTVVFRKDEASGKMKGSDVIFSSQ